MSKQLVRAILEGSTNKVKKLIRDPNSINKKDENGRTALHYAAEEGQQTIVKLLLAKKVLLSFNFINYNKFSVKLNKFYREMQM